MLVAAGTASASADGCSGLSCVDVRGTTTYVERIGGGVRWKGCGKAGYYRNHASGTLASGSSYKVYGSWKYLRSTPEYCHAAVFAIKSEWFPRKRFKAGTPVCNSVQRYANGTWITESKACIQIRS